MKDFENRNIQNEQPETQVADRALQISIANFLTEDQDTSARLVSEDQPLQARAPYWLHPLANFENSSTAAQQAVMHTKNTEHYHPSQNKDTVPVEKLTYDMNMAYSDVDNNH